MNRSLLHLAAKVTAATSHPPAHIVSKMQSSHVTKSQAQLVLSEAIDLCKSGAVDEAASLIKPLIRESPEQTAEIASYDQRSPEWLHARRSLGPFDNLSRLTSSNFAAIIGMNPYKSTHKYLQELLWPDTSTFRMNAAIQAGIDEEPIIADELSRFLSQEHAPRQVSLSFPNLIVSSEQPFLAGSPDGFVHMCDAGEQMDCSKIAATVEIKRPTERTGLYPCIPAYYYAQIQGVMHITGSPECIFAVATTNRMRVERFPRDDHYIATILVPGLVHFFEETYLPRWIQREAGLLQYGEVDPVVRVHTQSDLSAWVQVPKRTRARNGKRKLPDNDGFSAPCPSFGADAPDGFDDDDSDDSDDGACPFAMPKSKKKHAMCT